MNLFFSAPQLKRDPLGSDAPRCAVAFATREMNQMSDWNISNRVVGALWLIAGGGLSYWFNSRRQQVWRILYAEEGPKPTPEEADAIRARLVMQAFLAGGAWVLLFVVLDALF